MLEVQYINFNQLSKVEQDLLNEAEKAMSTAYNPYSNFFVGAALLPKKGEIVAGSNVENAAYGSTICAERSAIVAANAKEIRQFTKIALIGKGLTFETQEVLAPCGSCRQMLFESSQVSNFNLELILSNTRKDKIVKATIQELLPFGFGPEDLGINIEKYRK